MENSLDEVKNIIFEKFEKERAEYYKEKREMEASIFERGARLAFSLVTDEFGELKMKHQIPEEYIEALRRAGNKLSLTLSDMRR